MLTLGGWILLDKREKELKLVVMSSIGVKNYFVDTCLTVLTFSNNKVALIFVRI